MIEQFVRFSELLFRALQFEVFKSTYGHEVKPAMIVKVQFPRTPENDLLLGSSTL